MNQGKWVIAGMLLLGVVAAGLAWGFRFSQTNQVHTLFGTEQVRLILHSPAASAIELKDHDDLPPQEPVELRRADVKHAPGILNIRHMLTQDASFDWESMASAKVLPLPWSYALEFMDGSAQVQLHFDADCGRIETDNARTFMLIRPAIAKELRDFFAEQFP